jgi:hypothetical protein
VRALNSRIYEYLRQNTVKNHYRHIWLQIAMRIEPTVNPAAKLAD